MLWHIEIFFKYTSTYPTPLIYGLKHLNKHYQTKIHGFEYE